MITVREVPNVGRNYKPEIKADSYFVPAVNGIEVTQMGSSEEEARSIGKDVQRLMTNVNREQGPIPPQPKMANHHWLEVRDGDGHSFGLVVAQWNPGAQRWSHSGNVATGLYLCAEHWRYVAPCPMPEL